jgi:(p)ppGpp synthase/HD superfamily hydrolase
MHPQEAAAKAIATIAHKGQTDKNGEDYISHPSRVADRLSEPAQVAAAWLHDVIEDCSEVFAGTPPFGITGDDLLRAGIETEVVDAVVLLTRAADGKGGDAYYQAIRRNPIALAVKRADIADNLDPARTLNLDPVTRERLAEKYAHALAILGEE